MAIYRAQLAAIATVALMSIGPASSALAFNASAGVGVGGASAGVGVSGGQGAGVSAGANAGVGGTSAGVSAGVGGGTGANAGAGASVGGISAGVSVGTGSGTTATGRGPTAGTSSGLSLANVSDRQLARMKKRCIDILNHPRDYDRALFDLCRIVRRR